MNKTLHNSTPSPPLCNAAISCAAPWRSAARSVSAGLGGLAALAPMRTARAADYKALVCVFLYGGNDGSNTIVPTDATRHGQYSTVRGAMALPRGSLLSLGGQRLRPAPVAVGADAAVGRGQAGAAVQRRPAVRAADQGRSTAAPAPAR